MKHVDLFFGRLGNGTTIANKTVTENGDYQHIAHVQDWGKITYYVDPANLPADALEHIRRYAAGEREKFLEKWHKLPLETRYFKLLDAARHKDFVEAVSGKTHPLADRVATLEQRIKEY